MAKRKPLKFFLILLLIAGLIFASYLIFSQYFQTFFTPNTGSYLQSVGPELCGGSACASYADGLSVSDTATINIGGGIEYKVICTKADLFEKLYCPTVPSGAVNVKTLSVDTDGCTHYSYDIPRTEQKDCGDPSSSSGQCVASGNCWYYFKADCDGKGGTFTNWGPSCRSYPDQPYVYQFSQCSWNEHIADSGNGQYLTYDPTTGTPNRGCYERCLVYRNNVLIDTVRAPGKLRDGSFGNAVKTYLPDGTFTEGVLGNQNQATIYFNDYNQFISNTCYHIRNSYAVRYPKLVDLQISTPKSSYMEGENVQVKITITNNFGAALTGNLKTKFTVPTILSDYSITNESWKTINPGVNEITYNIPTNMRTESLRVQPYFDFYLPTTYISGVNLGSNYFPQSTRTDHLTQISPLRPYNWEDKFFIGQFYGNESKVLINPKPIYYNSTGTCISGYTLSKDGKYCLSDEISKLSCVQTGCPTGFNPPYVCGSSGFCAQTIYTPMSCTSDSQCPQTPTATKCDTGTGYCIEKVIYEKVVQCSVSSDCLIPCEGKTATCSNSQCVYSGECTIKQCTSNQDCSTPCAGITGTCQANKCVSSGKCITQPASQPNGFWDLIKNIWNKFLNWVTSFF